MQIIWTHIARITFLEILGNLERNWTENEVRKFIELTDANLLLISTNKVDFPAISSYSEIRKLNIHPTVSLFYKIDDKKEKLYLITFFNNRMDPKILKNY